MSQPLCNQDCTGALPGFDFSKCNPDIENGQIAKVFFAIADNPLSNWSSVVEWASRIDNDAAASNSIRTLIGIGDMPAPESTEKEISLGRKIQGIKKFTINFKVDEVNENIHEAMRVLQCNTGNFALWFETRDHKLFGGNSGVYASIKVDQIIPESYQDIIYYQLTITWESQYMPEMIDSPILDTTGDQF